MKNIITRKINLKPQSNFHEDCIVVFHSTAEILQRFYPSELGLTTVLHRKTEGSGVDSEVVSPTHLWTAVLGNQLLV